MEYLTTHDVIYINETQVGSGALRDRGLLESAVARPQQTIFGEDAYPDIHSKAAALMESLVLNHPFVDGNKRTAFLANVAFYGINGWDFDISTVAAVRLVIDVATHELKGVPAIAAELETWSAPPG